MSQNLRAQSNISESSEQEFRPADFTGALQEEAELRRLRRRLFASALRSAAAPHTARLGVGGGWKWDKVRWWHNGTRTTETIITITVPADRAVSSVPCLRSGCSRCRGSSRCSCPRSSTRSSRTPTSALPVSSKWVQPFPYRLVQSHCCRAETLYHPMHKIPHIYRHAYRPPPHTHTHGHAGRLQGL